MGNILVFVAHPDDEVIGVGGTIKKFVEHGENIIVIIFSCGEKSHPMLKEQIIMKQRINEAKRVGKLLGVKETIFLAVPDGKFGKKMDDKTFLENLKRLINKYNPNKIFTHSSSDLHRDHIAVNKIMCKVLRDMKYGGELLTFEVWNPLQFFKRENPKIYVDISQYFKIKLKALEMIKSQKYPYIYVLLPAVYIRAKLDGSDINVSHAEKFNEINITSK